MRITTCGMTDVGMRRSQNEDNYLVNDELDLYVVCDGMGGHVGGEFASAIAVTTVEEVFTGVTQEELELSEDSGVLDAMRERLRVAVKLAGRRIFDKGQEDSEYRGMGTTCLALWLGEGNAILAHVGDSRGYLVRSSRIEQLTEDHSLVNERIRAGLMSPDEARNHRLKNVITRSLGYMQEVEVDIQVREVEQGDHFVLCSDGLSNLVEAAEIAERVLELGPEDASRSLIALACERGGDDNITVVVARVDEVN